MKDTEEQIVIKMAITPKVTNNFTLTFPGEQLLVLSDLMGTLIEDKFIRLEDIHPDQLADLVAARNMIRKQLDFPDLKF